MKRNILFYALLMICIICGTSAYSQEKYIVVNGTVIDKETKQGVPGVSVILEETNKGLTQTNGKGQFTVNVPIGGNLLFKFLGFNTQRTKITGATNITVTIAEDRKALDEVIIVAYQKGAKKPPQDHRFQFQERIFRIYQYQTPSNYCRGRFPD